MLPRVLHIGCLALALLASTGCYQKPDQRGLYASCGSDDECESSNCQDGYCTASCIDDSPCAAGICFGNVCTDPGRMQCVSDEDCSSLQSTSTCRKASCSAGKCAVAVSPNGAPCGLACEQGMKVVGACSSGLCGPGGTPPESCSDHDACTDDSCADGLCVHAVKTCEDNDNCTVNGCAKATGCTFEPIPCDDKNPCTIDGCDENAKCASKAVDCNDGNPCTDDTCIGGACKTTANTGPCDDGNPCTVADTCGQGACGGNRQTVCAEASLGDTLKLACPPGKAIAWVQQVAYGKLLSGCPGPVVDTSCAASGVAAWVAASCVGLNSCQLSGWASVFGQPCADANLALAALVECAPSAQIKACDDGDVCTNDVCSLADGSCQHAKVAGACP